LTEKEQKISCHGFFLRHGVYLQGKNGISVTGIEAAMNQ